MIQRYCQAKKDQIRLSRRWPWHSVYFTNQHTTLVTAPRLTHSFHASCHCSCAGLLTSPGSVLPLFVSGTAFASSLCCSGTSTSSSVHLLWTPRGCPPPCQQSVRGEQAEVLERGNLKKGFPCFNYLVFILLPCV